MNFLLPITPATTGPRVDADADAERLAAARRDLGDDVEHVERHLGDRLGVIGARLRQPAGDHVAVADRLDLLEAVLLGEVVERAEQLVEHADDRARAAAATTAR